MLRIAICDDMPEALSQLKDLILHWNSDSSQLTVQTFQDADALLSAHSGNSFDIIFLDVIMPLLNGIEAARELRQLDRNVKIVFLTTSPEYAVESYTVKANNYLLKPVSAEILYHCLNELYEEILAQEKHITIRGTNAVHRIPIGKIEYIEAQNKQVLFSSILSNALDNALNAQKEIPTEQRSIRLMLKTVGDKLLLSVKNPTCKKPVFSDGLPVTDKKGHGYGTQSIRYMSERLGGNCQFSFENGIFSLRVII